MRGFKPAAFGAVIGVKAILLCTAVVMALTPAATAQRSAFAVVDGKPTQTACLEYGYHLGGYAEAPRRRFPQMPRVLPQGSSSGAAEEASTASPAPPPLQLPPVADRGAFVPAPAIVPPPPPPPPAPLVGSSVQSVVVTGSRTHGGPPQTGAWPVNRDRYPEADPNPIKLVAEAPVSTLSVDVDTASYSNVRRHLREGTLPPRDAVRVEELINYFDYGYPAPERSEVFRPWVAVAPSPWNGGKQLMHVGLRGYDIDARNRPPLNLVFLVDVSGSMQPADRLPLARQALNTLIDGLRPQDRVSMAVYAGAAGEVLPPTRGHEKLRMRCALQALQAGGSTAGGQGLALAYQMAQRNFDPEAVNRVVLLTDGDFNVGVTDDRKLEDFVAAKRKTGVYLSVYGFGGGNYNDRLMQVLAQNGNGSAGYVDSLAESRKLFADDFAGSLFPIADDVKVQVEFNPARVSEYRLIGYETRLLKREDFNNDAVDAGEVGSGVAVTALYELTPAGGASSVDPLRYGQEQRAPRTGGELAFVKVRYKAPGAAQSVLRERPITDRDIHPSLDRAPEQLRWAAAVASYGQLLRDDEALPRDYGWAEVERLAAPAVGGDPHGLRREFLTLVSAARSAPTLNDERPTPPGW